MIYMTGDTHGAFDIHKINPDEFIAGRSLTKDDYVIIAGDFGCIWDGGSSDKFWMNWLESLPWNTLFIDGNHENFDVLNAYPVEEWKGGKVHKIRDNVIHLMRGQVYDIDGEKILTVGGAFSHDTAMRTQGKNWWKQEMITKEEEEETLRNLEKNNYNVDYIVTHDVYASHPYAGLYETDMSVYDENQCDIQKFLETIRERTNYRKWFTGHYHKDAVYMADGKPTFTLYNTIRKAEDYGNDMMYIPEVEVPARAVQTASAQAA